MIRDSLIKELKEDFDDEKTIIYLDNDDPFGTIYIAQKEGSQIDCVEINFEQEDILVELLAKSKAIHENRIKEIKRKHLNRKVINRKGL